jgi:hypothetical protein
VQNRPRSRSTGGAGHSRKGSALGSGSGVLVGGMNGGGGGHGRTGSFNGAASNVGGVSGHRQLRSSLGQMQWKDTMEGGAGPNAARGQDSASPPLINTGGSPLMARNGSGGSMKAGEGGMGRNSPVGMTGHRKSGSSLLSSSSARFLTDEYDDDRITHQSHRDSHRIPHLTHNRRINTPATFPIPSPFRPCIVLPVHLFYQISPAALIPSFPTLSFLLPFLLVPFPSCLSTSFPSTRREV